MDSEGGTLVTIDPLRIGQWASITQDRHPRDPKPRRGAFKDGKGTTKFLSFISLNTLAERNHVSAKYHSTQN